MGACDLALPNRCRFPTTTSKSSSVECSTGDGLGSFRRPFRTCSFIEPFCVSCVLFAESVVTGLGGLSFSESESKSKIPSTSSSRASNRPLTSRDGSISDTSAGRMRFATSSYRTQSVPGLTLKCQHTAPQSQRRQVLLQVATSPEFIF